MLLVVALPVVAVPLVALPVVVEDSVVAEAVVVVETSAAVEASAAVEDFKAVTRDGGARTLENAFCLFSFLLTHCNKTLLWHMPKSMLGLKIVRMHSWV